MIVKNTRTEVTAIEVELTPGDLLYLTAALGRGYGYHDSTEGIDSHHVYDVLHKACMDIGLTDRDIYNLSNILRFSDVEDRLVQDTDDIPV